MGRVTGHGLASNIRRRFPRAVLYAIVALLGTTISPYLFFWQAAQEVEELNADPSSSPLVHAPEDARTHLRASRSIPTSAWASRT
jgi:Mn2+/Fe2+ NRAMP family transporter